MPQYYKILDNGQKPVKEKAMPRKNQNTNRQGGKKVNYRMREGSNYYGDVTAKKKESAFGKAEAGRMGRVGRASNSRAEDARLAGKRKARTSGRTADSRSGRGGASRAEDSRMKSKAPSKNYKKGLYR